MPKDKDILAVKVQGLRQQSRSAQAKAGAQPASAFGLPSFIHATIAAVNGDGTYNLTPLSGARVAVARTILRAEPISTLTTFTLGEEVGAILRDPEVPLIISGGAGAGGAVPLHDHSDDDNGGQIPIMGSDV